MAAATAPSPASQPRPYSFWSSFPLWAFPTTAGPSNRTADAKPILHVPQQAGLSSWCSSDIAALRYQVELTLRGLDFDIEQRNLDQWWGPGSRAGSPFLQLKQRRRLINEDSLDTWAETVQPWKWERVELEKENSAYAPYPSSDLKDEATMWKTLLEKSLTAGVLLAQLFDDDEAKRATQGARVQRGIFSRLLTSHLESQRNAQTAQRIASLSTASGTSSSSLARWTSYIPGITSAISFTGIGLQGFPTPATAAEKPEYETDIVGEKYISWPANLDVEQVMLEAIETIDAVAQRLSNVESDNSGVSKWFLAANEPTQLDAMLFALLHTILTLPSDNEQGPAARLRRAVLQHEVLLKWTRAIYDESIKPKESQWQEAASS